MNINDVNNWLRETMNRNELVHTTVASFIKTYEKRVVTLIKQDAKWDSNPLFKIDLFKSADFSQSQDGFNLVKNNVAIIINGKLKAKKEFINEWIKNQNLLTQPKSVVVDVNGKKENVDVEVLNETEEKALDSALDQYRAIEMAKLGNGQVKVPEHDKTDVSSSVESTNAQIVAPKKKSKQSSTIDVTGVGREIKKRDRYAEQLESRERAQEKRQAAEEYTEVRDSKQDIINREVEEHDLKKQNLKEDVNS